MKRFVTIKTKAALQQAKTKMSNLKSAQDVWDENAIHIEDNLDSFQLVAGSSVMRKADFINAMEELESIDINDWMRQFMKESPAKFAQIALLMIAKDIQKSNATDFTLSQESDLSDGKRYKITVKAVIEAV